jgi:glycosyltransferase involved in cell wall biosynthesis
MPKAKGFTSSKLKKPYFPFVSVCTPTFNRRPFIPFMLDCFRNQDYPKDRMEWIIVDDGTDKIKDLIDQATDLPQIKYVQPPKRMNLGEKRNYMHTLAKGSIIVYMDDDDYYPPERVSHAVETLMSNRDALCAGSSELYIYFKHIGKMFQCGPYGPNHATAGTFAFRSSMLDQTKYENTAALAEERAFLKDYTIPFVQLDPMKTILVFSHSHNTFDKKRLLENPHPDFFKISPKTIDMFIKNDNEKHIKEFFTKDIETMLAKYEPGHPKMKPEVLAQTKQIEEERRKMIEHAMNPALSNGLNPMNGNIPSNAIPPFPPGAENNITIMMQEEGKAPVPMNMQQIVQLLQNQQNENNRLKTETDTLRHRIGEMEDIIRQLQQLKVNSAQTAQSNPAPPAFSYTMPSGSGVATSTTRLKSDPEVNIRA